jgi:DNA replication protein DnaC
MATYAQLNNNLEALSLNKIKDILPSYLDDKRNTDKSIVDILHELSQAEIDFRDDRAKRINITVSSFPYHKTINDFDFTYQPTINKTKILDLASLRFMDEKSNIIFMGSPGTGKTHLATALGIEAASQRISTYFINFAELMEKFKQASKENRVEKIVKHYLKYSLLIIDEIGYLPVDRDSSYGFFQLIAARYENRSTILTTNQPFSKWGEVFGDPVIANAIIDRLVHHCEVIKINGMSYRIKDKNIFEEEN